MATISSSITLNENMTAPLQNITRSMNIVINAFQRSQTASSQAFNTTHLNGARMMLEQVNVEIRQIVTDTQNANRQQQEYNESLKQAKERFEGVGQFLRNIMGSAADVFSAKKIIEISDAYTTTTTRLNLINDGMQTTAELQNQIMESADRSRTTYGEIAPVISKLGVLAGEVFSSNKEMVYFAELMNKNFVIGGASAQEQSTAMYQLTQAMASGRLQGDEFQSILKNAPLLAKAISTEMGVPLGQLKIMSSEGLITADIIKAAMINSAAEIEAEYSKIPYTYGQVWAMISNDVYRTFEPLIRWIGSGAQFIYDNWAILRPMFYGLGSAVFFYEVATGVAYLKTLLLNKALLSNPLGWLMLVIGAFIAYIFYWTESMGGAKIAWASLCYGIEVFWTTAMVNVRTTLNSMDIFIQTTLNSWISKINWVLEKMNVSMRIETLNFASEKVAERNQKNFDDMKRLEMRADELRKIKQEEEKKKKESATSETTKNSEYKEISTATKETAKNTGQIKESLKASVDELKLLREVARRQAIATFTTRDIKLDMSGMNVQMTNDSDYNVFIGKLSEDLREIMGTTGEGVHV
ncbi:MAG: tape measure protein [Filifactoraceae bacterium]